MKGLSKFILWISGWKIKGEVPADIKKAVMIAAPHTSYWDFFYARAAFFIMELPVKTTIKKEAVNIPVIGWFARKLGAIAIDRTPKNPGKKNKVSMVDAMANLLKDNELMFMMVTPEGTRKYVPRWKTGFYRVAEQAGVPIILGYLDYKSKTAGVGPVFYPTGDYDKDLKVIMDFYKEKSGKYPEKGVR
ncbi:MAG: 1-acyl-sn-glycerol-3-phosphate acyltransferase [Bacteroidota bacterium]